MRRIPQFMLIALLALPSLAHALQLHWADGTTDVTVTQDTQVVLVVQADSAEVTLPDTWRLQWTSDSLRVQFRAFDPSSACLVDTAKVDSIAPPSTPADSAANQTTAWFCSSGSSKAVTAYFLVGLPSGGRGKMKVVALSSTDTTQVIESNEVTYNGGIDGDYAPLVLTASSQHAGELLTVTVLGSALSQTSSVSIGSADQLWAVPLSIASAGNTQLVATALVPSQLPEALVSAEDPQGRKTSVFLPADPFTLDLSTVADTSYYTDPDPSVYPKDFAFYFNTVPSGDSQHPWMGIFHLFYIRHFKVDGSEPYIAHAWSTDLVTWHTNDLVDFVPGTGWDSKHVWAPSIIKIGTLFYMFYAGVDGGNNQRIGYVTATHLDSVPDWSTSNRRMVYDADSTHWANPAYAVQYSGQQFRDPFIIEDPDSSGRYVLFQIGEDKLFQKNQLSLGTTVVGVAKNRLGTVDRWLDYGEFRITDSTHVGLPLQPVSPDSACAAVPPPVVPVVESPMAMRDSLTGAWRLFFTNADYNCTGSNSTWFVNAAPNCRPADTTLAKWSGLTNLYPYLGSKDELLGWAAMKHLQVGNKWHFFAAYNGVDIGIVQAHWDTSAKTFVISKPNFTGVGRGGTSGRVRFYLSDFRPGSGTARFVVETPTLAVPRLVLYDVAGRKVRVLTDGMPVVGHREYVWDLRDGSGVAVRSGMYFVRLSGLGRGSLLRLPVVR